MTAQLSLDAAENLDAQIQETLMGRLGPYPLTDQQRGVLHMLRYRRGAGQARPLAELATELKMQPRTVKDAVKSLVEEFAIPIGAARTGCNGYFLCITPDDIEDAIRPLVHEIVSLARRVRVLGGAERLAELFGQMQLQHSAVSTQPSAKVPG
jgi:hypothetical protein